ncbi:CLIP domain-containing serine protease B15-like [Armigeres subalbatus]|uniref:CLIP domain-containing serine protease B15-like n=1 Tax=Armigeres subalbatus TaxID=124917 RepID=UPI002ED60F40
MQSKRIFKLSILVFLVMFERVIGQELNQLCNNPKSRIGRCIRRENCSVVAGQPDKDSVWNGNVCRSNGKQNQEVLVCCPILKNCATCGELEQTAGDLVVNRITGGSEAEPGSYPWAALLIYMGRTVTKSLCGGVLISLQHVLTAAHCIEGLPRNWRLHGVHLGHTDNLQNCSHIENGKNCKQEYVVQRTIIHEQYDRLLNSHVNDIALLHLAKEVTLSAYIKPICLPLDDRLQNMPVENEQFTVVGWGETETGYNSPKLLQVSVTGRNLDMCNRVFQNHKIRLSDTQLCVGGEGGKDSCRGDSGGPLMRRIGNVWYLTGMVSFGDRTCGVRNQPSVYTNVVSYIDWIEHQMIELS